MYINVLDFLVIFSYSSVTGDVLYKEPLKLFDKASYTCDIAMNVQKAT